jgi:hypothetical protein
MRPIVVVVLLIIASALPAIAGPVDDVKRCMLAMQALHSYHMSSAIGGESFETDVVKPGRMHMRSARMEAIMLPGMTYMKMGGKWTKFANTGSRSFAADIDKANAYVAAGNFSATDLGIKIVNGTPLHAYSVTLKSSSSPFTLYVGAHDLPRRMEFTSTSGTLAATFSEFNAPMTITAPM